MATRFDAGHDGAMRGRAWALVKDGGVLRSGSEPSMADPGESNSEAYFRAMADENGADLYIGAPPTFTITTGESLIFGMTWDELMRKQNRHGCGRPIVGRMPDSAVLAYSPTVHDAAPTEPISAA